MCPPRITSFGKSRFSHLEKNAAQHAKFGWDQPCPGVSKTSVFHLPSVRVVDMNQSKTDQFIPASFIVGGGGEKEGRKRKESWFA